VFRPFFVCCYLLRVVIFFVILCSFIFIFVVVSFLWVVFVGFCLFYVEVDTSFPLFSFNFVFFAGFLAAVFVSLFLLFVGELIFFLFFSFCCLFYFDVCSFQVVAVVPFVDPFSSTCFLFCFFVVVE